MLEACTLSHSVISVWFRSLARKLAHFLWVPCALLETIVIWRWLYEFATFCWACSESIELPHSPHVFFQNRIKTHTSSTVPTKPTPICCNHEAEPWVCLDMRSMIAQICCLWGWFYVFALLSEEINISERVPRGRYVWKGHMVIFCHVGVFLLCLEWNHGFHKWFRYALFEIIVTLTNSFTISLVLE
jgi:hypothetical protein